MSEHSYSFSLSQLASLLKVEFKGNPEVKISGVADLESANVAQASFLANPRYEQAMKDSKAGVIVVSKNQSLIEGKNYLLADDPSRTFQGIIELFAAEHKAETGFTGIHPTAVVHKEALIGEDVTLGPYVVVDKGAKIAPNTIIHAHSFVGANTTIGPNCTIYQNVVIREACVIGSRVVIQPGAVIGSCGFGFTTDKTGRHTKLNQLGNVVIEDDVEIGANTTIDRARFQSTVIAEGSKIDNLVQIAHGVKVGKHNLIVAQTGIAGSTETGRNVVLAGQVAVNGHISLGDGVIVTARSGVSKSLPLAGKYGGVPAMPLQEYNKMAVHLQNITKLVDDVKKIKQQLAELSLKK